MAVVYQHNGPDLHLGARLWPELARLTRQRRVKSTRMTRHAAAAKAGPGAAGTRHLRVKERVARLSEDDSAAHGFMLAP